VRTKISIALAKEFLKAIDRRAKQQGTTRSNFIEGAVRAFIRRLPRDAQSAHDLEIINRHADFLNQEARDVLEYSRPAHIMR
jgi:metal-responsive CopG/Arc/MetJ family transcriptional regulator